MHLTNGENTTEMQTFIGLPCRLNEKRRIWSLAHGKHSINGYSDGDDDDDDNGYD